MTSVSIGYTHYGDVKEPFMSSMLELSLYEERSTRNIASFISVGGPTITENRNRIASEFLKQGHEWLLFLDTDMGFSPDLVQKLLVHASPDKMPIIAGLYFGKMGNDFEKIVPIWMVHEDDNELSACKDISQELTELTAAGTGCLLIHRSVLFRMRMESDDPWPWFGHDIFVKENGKPSRLGEDITFCLRARKLGVPIYGLREPLSHIKTHHVTIQTYMNQRIGENHAA